MILPDRNKYIPLYYQLKEILHDKIEDESWSINMRLPSEKELCEIYKVSRITVRMALKQLEIEGRIRRDQGKGTFIEDKKAKDLILQSLTGTFAFSEEVNFSTTVVEKNIEKANEQIYQTLKLTKRGMVTKLVRIRIVRGAPLYWTKAYIPLEICPELIHQDFEKHSLFEILKNLYALEAVSATRTIETVLASSRATNYLGVAAGTPINLVTSTSYLADGRPLEFSKNYFRSDKVIFEVKIGISP